MTTDGCDGCQIPETRPAVGLHPARESPEVRLLFKNLEPGGETPTFKRSFQAIWRKNGRTHSEVRSFLGITPLAEDETTLPLVFCLTWPPACPASLLPWGLLSICRGPACWEGPVSPSFIYLWTDQA